MVADLTTVFVLGAGFTRTFAPKPPLLVDDYDILELQSKFLGLPYASRLLELEFNRSLPDKVDLERLMTLLEGGMPYDSYGGSEAEVAALAYELRKRFHARVSGVEVPIRRQNQLRHFAKHLVETNSHVVTFNYDDIIDQKLWEVHRLTTIPGTEIPYWHPDGRYWFFCRPASLTVEERNVFMDRASMHLLKLHESSNWRVRRRAPSIAPVDSIMHFEDWLPDELGPEFGERTATPADIELHLEPEPLWVPPVLLKSAVAQQPVLGLVWHRACEVLHGAQQVVFIGYSFPVTDIAVRTLFEEALEDLPPGNITIVSLAEDPVDMKAIRTTYRQSFGDIPDDQFHFDGESKWVREKLSRNGRHRRET
ncbi:MAG TPA: hypothetical protein EYM32_14855 [Dehalococcoidia bacterium]|nr:hypothetical protein [Dehalococcoidia bacterium]